jgi:hypothetical protein
MCFRPKDKKNVLEFGKDVLEPIRKLGKTVFFFIPIVDPQMSYLGMRKAV